MKVKGYPKFLENDENQEMFKLKKTLGFYIEGWKSIGLLNVRQTGYSFPFPPKKGVSRKEEGNGKTSSKQFFLIHSIFTGRGN